MQAHRVEAWVWKALDGSPTRRWRAVAAVAVLLTAVPGVASAGVANRGVRGAWRTNPIAGIRWGHYTGPIDGVWPAYASSQGRTRRLLGKIALRPIAHWFGSWDQIGTAHEDAARYIAEDTGGNPNVLSQLAVFRLDPWEYCGIRVSSQAQRAYRGWVRAFASGIGSSRVALILQPDLPFATCAADGGPLGLVAYAARRFAALPHTTVYIDAGAAYWPMHADQAADMLIRAGIRRVRGFAMNDTQYDATGRELEWGAKIIAALDARGVHGKHMVVNTAESGAPFLAGQYHGNLTNPRVCRNRSDRICVTLGIPPTTAVASPRWHLFAHDRSLAFRFADAYLWIGRPWLYNGSSPFDRGRALGMAASSPF